MADRLRLLRTAASVKRLHTRRTIHSQTVGEHTFGVLGLLFEVCEPSIELVKAALYHDVPEAITGDVPSPAKRVYAIKEAFEAFEDDIELVYSLTTTLTPLEQRLLRFCDVMELIIFATEEAEMGNAMMLMVRERALSYLLRDGLYNINDATTTLFLKIQHQHRSIPGAHEVAVQSLIDIPENWRTE
jgi:5'-deoxynucleotidase YfbR-like HD superfamily hydrolase